jgi:hypothetical protein
MLQKKLWKHDEKKLEENPIGTEVYRILHGHDSVEKKINGFI